MGSSIVASNSAQEETYLAADVLLKDTERSRHTAKIISSTSNISLDIILEQIDV
jgi:hypothetical protein